MLGAILITSATPANLRRPVTEIIAMPTTPDTERALSRS